VCEVTRSVIFTDKNNSPTFDKNREENKKTVKTRFIFFIKIVKK